MNIKFDQILGKLRESDATFDGNLDLTPLTLKDQNTGTVYELTVKDGILTLAESLNITTGILLQTGDYLLLETGEYLLQE